MTIKSCSNCHKSAQYTEGFTDNWPFPPAPWPLALCNEHYDQAASPAKGRDEDGLPWPPAYVSLTRGLFPFRPEGDAGEWTVGTKSPTILTKSPRLL